MEQFKYCTPAQLLARTSVREGETKLGQVLECLVDFKELKNYSQRFVLLGIEEDVGVRANSGKAGAAGCWEETLKALCNVQANAFFPSNELLIAGSLAPWALMEEAKALDQAKDADLAVLRQLTGKIDELLIPLVQSIVHSGKVPIFIGGGHNNAYGNIKGSTLALNQPISCLNIDPHADFRKTEGRHSGNGFRYAFQEGILERYAVWGLHESYNNQEMLELFHEEPELHYQTFEDLLHKDFVETDRLYKDTLQWLGHDACGLELDLDSIEGFPVSALNGSGFSINEVRHYVRTMAALKMPVYFHICEGAPEHASTSSERLLSGKRIASLLTDFVKAYGQWNS